jgi:hypothetical protein
VSSYFIKSEKNWKTWDFVEKRLDLFKLKNFKLDTDVDSFGTATTAISKDRAYWGGIERKWLSSGCHFWQVERD